MATSTTPRLALPRWSAGADPLTRVQVDGGNASLEDRAAGGLAGTLATRPAAGPGNARFIYHATDTGDFYWSTGAAWVLLENATSAAFQRANHTGTQAIATVSGLQAAIDAALIPVQDEGVTVTADPSAINFVGAGVTATNVGTVATVTISVPIKTVRIPHTWHVPGEVKVAVGDTDFILPFYVPEPAGQTSRLVAVRYGIKSGTSATFKLQVAGVDAAGFTALAATTTAATTDPADVDVTDGQAISLVVTAVSATPRNLAVTAWFEYTF